MSNCFHSGNEEPGQPRTKTLTATLTPHRLLCHTGSTTVDYYLGPKTGNYRACCCLDEERLV
jgi:hypothetical protein